MDRDGENAKERLLRVAIELFATKGFSATSVREIAERARVTKPVLYYYFKNKAQLFRSILEEAARMQKDIIEDVLESKVSAQEKFLLLFREMKSGVVRNPGLFRLIHALVFGPPRACPDFDLHSFHRRTTAALQRIYQEGLAGGELIQEDPEDVALVMLGVMDLLFHMILVEPHVLPPERPERLLRLALRGLAERE